MRTALSMLALTLAACGSHRAATPVTSTATVHQAVVSQAAPMTDDEVLGVLRAIDDAELALGDLGQRLGVSDDVRALALGMLHEHQSSRAREHALEASARVTPMDATDAARHVRHEGENAVEELRRRNGAAFDRLWLETQIRAHRDVIVTIDRLLLPSARNAEVKSLVAGTRRFVEDHLAKAEALRSKLDGAHDTDRGKDTNTTRSP